MSIFSIQRILVFLLMMLPFEAAASTRHALLIGNSRYEVAAPLRNPENDIEIVGAALEKSGFAVTRVANAKAVDTLAAVDAFVARLTTVESPIVMVYFAGHGIQVAGENYLLPVDAKLGSEEELRSIALSLGDLTRRLDAVRSSLQIVVLDSCRDNPFEQTRGLRRGLATAPERLGRIVAFSTSPGNVATDGDTGASPYATALAESVTIPGLSIEDVFKRVRATVQERTGGKQEPWENSAVYGDFQFTEGKPAEAGGDEVAFFEFAALADSQEAYQKYLSRYPQGMFASLAKQKIEFMDKDFSFRKQSETFRYVTFENNHEDRCGKMRFNKSEEKMRHVLADGEVVLMRLEFWVPYEACPQTSYYLRTQEKKPENDSIYSANMAGTDIFASSHLEITADQERRINEAFSSKARVAWGMSGSRGWGQPADYQLQARFQTSSGGMGVAVRKPGDAAKADIIEYGCEDNCIIFQALVRVYDRTGPDEAADGAEEYEIDFVSAAELGLTWKYQNTLRELAKVQEAEVATLALKEKQRLTDVTASYDPLATAPFRKTRVVGGWEVMAILDDNRIFRNCRAIRRHDDRLFSLFRLDAFGTVTFGFFDPQGGFAPNSGQMPAYRLDGLEMGSTSRLQSPNEVAYSVATTPQAIEALKAAREISLPEGTASLAGSRAMLAELEACVAAFGG